MGEKKRKSGANRKAMQKQKILIVDDSEINRILLRDILEDQYEITEAENGAQAVEILAKSEAKRS